MKTEELNDYICRLTKFFAKPRYPKDSSNRCEDRFMAEGLEFYIHEKIWHSPLYMSMNCVLTVYPSVRVTDTVTSYPYSVSVRYSVTGRPEYDLESRVKACMDLAWEFVSKALSGLNMELLTAVRNEEVERVLAVLE